MAVEARSAINVPEPPETGDTFEGNALVVLHPAPTDAKMDEIRGFHHKTREILGENKKPKIFPEHVLSVMEIAKKLPNTPKVFIDAGAGFMLFDQVKHYLDAGIVSEVITLKVTLAKTEKMTIPYVYDNAHLVGAVDEKNSFVKVIRKGSPHSAEESGDSHAGHVDPDMDADEPVKPKSRSSKEKTMSASRK